MARVPFWRRVYHPALVPHAGPDTRIFTEAVELGAVLRRLADVAGSVVTADAAVLVDTDSRWALESRGLPSPHVRHLDVARAAHAALCRSGIGCDIAAPDADLSRYRLVVVPAVYLLSDTAAATLRRYTDGGGHLVVTFCSGIADESHRIRTGGYPGALRDILGIRAEEFHPLPPGTTARLSAATSMGRTGTCGPSGCARRGPRSSPGTRTECWPACPPSRGTATAPAPRGTCHPADDDDSTRCC